MCLRLASPVQAEQGRLCSALHLGGSGQVHVPHMYGHGLPACRTLEAFQMGQPMLLFPPNVFLPL